MFSQVYKKIVGGFYTFLSRSRESAEMRRFFLQPGRFAGGDIFLTY
jgi:hypothetical protein